MSPVDVLIETIQATVRFGDSPGLRAQQSAKLEAAILRFSVNASDADH